MHRVKMTDFLSNCLQFDNWS